MQWHSKSAAEAVGAFESDESRGLSAAAVERQRARYGENQLRERRRRGLLYSFAKQLCDFMIIILLAAAGISYLTSAAAGEPDPIEPLIILAIVLLNAAVGVAQESRAKHAITALQKISAPNSRVLREGRELQLPSEQLVCGDLLLLRAGDLVPADGRLVCCNGLRVEESALTGESLAVEKSSAVTLPESSVIAEHRNMVYSGTAVVSGSGRAVVTAVGMQTQLGRIAELIMEQRDEATPLQLRLARTGRVLGAAALAVCAAVFILGLVGGSPPLETFMLAVSLAVAAIPEGLPAIVTIVLALGVSRMARQNAIIRRLPAVETLGGTTVICSDKTGTLTQNRMSVTRTLCEGECDAKQTAALLGAAALCCDAVVQRSDEGLRVTGEPTEAAIVEAAARAGQHKAELERRHARVGELPFDSARRRMSTLHTDGSGFLQITKGAPELLLQRCVSINGEPLGAARRAALLRRSDELAGEALRVIGVAVRRYSSRPARIEEQGLDFIGMIGMLDPPKSGVREAVRQAIAAGIRPVMITGDHAVTALSIARQVGISTAAGAAVGTQLDGMSEQELRRCVRRYAVFARVTPEHKLRLIRAYQSLGEVVAMTGDGVNDAPALKAADIGCAMGRGGTQVARDAADMILVDDNFTTIVAAVREGRGIYDNIMRAVHFLLSCNIGEIITIFAAGVFRFPTPLFAIHLLWINLVTDSLPAIALGLEPPERDIMRRRPSGRGGSMFSGGRGLDMLLEGGMIGALSLLGFAIGQCLAGLAVGRTMAFAVLGLSQLTHALNMRSTGSLFKKGLLSNRLMLPSIALCVLLQLSVIMLPPLAVVFKTVPLSLAQWGAVLGLSIAPLFAVETAKLLRGRDGR